MAETTDYAYLEKRLRAAQFSHHLRSAVLMDEAASAISALVRERDRLQNRADNYWLRLGEAREALAQTLVWIKDGEFDDGSEQNCPVETIVPHGLDDMIEACLSRAEASEDSA